MDLTSPNTIRSIQQKFGFTFKKGLGQNFLTSSGVLEEITAAAKGADGIIEIGPGFGTLTAALAESFERVVAIEVDNRLTEVLSYTLAAFDNVKIINGDVMKLNLREIIQTEFPDKKVSIAANLPYYITTPVVTRLLEEKLPVNDIVIMVQREVAKRFCAEPATKDYGAITLLVRYFTEPEIISSVPASLFIPPPKVDSAVVRLRILDKPSVSVKSEELFFKTVRAAFSQRRKTLLNCLSSAFPISKENMSELLNSVGITPSRRGETLSAQEFAKTADAVFNFQKEKE